MTHFEVMGMPQGKARARTGKGFSYTPEKTVLYENLVKHSFLAAKEKQTYFDKEPLAMTIFAYFPIPKSMTKKDREKVRRNELFPTKKPDADNVAKVICDALNGVAYHDDTQIISLEVKKAYTEAEPYVSVRFGALEEFPY
jgi:Holliday junction resolvase RusA-like endonuclease